MGCINGSSGGTQGSFITIFSIWNATMGTSLLVIPWAITQAGFLLGIVLLIVMAGLNFYTAYIMITSTGSIKCPAGEVVEYSDVCRKYLGRVGEVLAVLFSCAIMVGAVIVYWVLMSNTLYSIVQFIYSSYYDIGLLAPESNSSFNDPYLRCTDDNVFIHEPVQLWHNATTNQTVNTHADLFNKFWHLQKTVPFFLLCLLVPLINFKSPTLFTKFNAAGVISAFYLVGFITYKTSRWGFHMDFNRSIEQNVRTSFPALTGVCTLAFLSHCTLVAIIRQQKNPKNNVRDLCIAYICVTLTYGYVGCAFYTTWPMISKDCIDQNFLNNLLASDPLAFVSRIFVFIQMFTAYPLILYIMRVQLMNVLFQSVWPSWKHVSFLNLSVVATCLLFARFMPQIATILRYTGTFCGQTYAIVLPTLTYMVSEKRKGQLTITKAFVHVMIIVFSVANIVAQFFLKM
ncbi:neutral amino acid transporter 9-like [Watersipora subatra]|uniref:neutral amino acid transporter 9-like n=1 Tax=Watersipora subatra TaxID=2589382 RepID=UPI00355BA6BE